LLTCLPADRKLFTGNEGDLAEFRMIFLLLVTWHLLYYVLVFQVRRIATQGDLMSSELIVTLHDKNVLATDSVVKESLTTGAGGLEKCSTCKKFLQVRSMLKREGKE
jgi:tRNA G26 N,N-dimethylase Trm1